MGQKLPTDFDGEWYAATYADVGMSGLRPSEHYRLFGRLLGRQTSPPAPPPAPPHPPPPAPALASAADVAQPASSEVEATTEQSPIKGSIADAPAKQQPEEPETPPIVDRPDGFDPATVVPKPAPPKLGAEPGGHFSLESLAAAGGSDASPSAVTSALIAYAKLVNAASGSDAAEEQAASCGAPAFQAGETCIENAWFASPNRLRLMFAGGTDSASGSSGSVVRAYQGECASPVHLKLLGEGIQLPPLGPVIHDVELLHPLMPLLLELADRDGITQAFTLLPFPSLLRGGLHGAELKALQTEPNPIDDFWAMSEALLREMLGGDGWPERSVSGVSCVKAASPDEPVYKAEVQQWLVCIFGIEPQSAAGRRRSRSKQTRLQLTLPPEFVPTISALVTRRLGELPGGAMTGSYLVSDAEDYRPRWSITLPAGAEPANAIPVLRRSDLASGSDPVEESAPMPLAIALRSPAVLPAAPAAASRGKKRLGASGALTVVIDASDAARTEDVVESIRAAGGEVEVFVRSTTVDPELRTAFERIGERTSVPPEADLRHIAKLASAETLLTISDRVDVDDGRSLGAVLDLLQRDETTGSASCALLAEKIIKRDVVLQPASGGLFPTGVSFLSGPKLAFGEPDALQALPGLAYPVVANTLLFTAWRRAALTELPPVPGTGPAVAEDLRIGLDLIRAGFRNWCTTQCVARLSGPYRPRDGIDPVGAGYLQPQGWEDILRRVTLVRELF